MYQSNESNYTPDPSLQKCLEIQYTQLRNLGSRLPYDKMAQNFFKHMDTLSCLTPATVVSNRCGYMLAIRDKVTLRSISIDKQADINFEYDEHGTLLGAIIRGRGCPEEVRYIGQTDTHTFFVVKFGQGSCCLNLGWNETNETTTISATTKPKPAMITCYVPSYTDSTIVSYPQEPPVASISNFEQMQCEVNNPIPENLQELKECTNVLVLVSCRNQRLWNTICTAMKEKQVIKEEDNRIIVRWMINPFNTFVVMVLAYDMENADAVRVAVPCADNIIFFGNSSMPHPYVLSAVASQNMIFALGKQFSTDCPWTKSSMDINSICDESGSILDLINVHRKGQCYALMTLDSDDYTMVPNMIHNITLRCKSTPITPQLYVCWKFTGLVDQTEEQYCHQVNEFIKHNSIPAVIDAVCRGCVAVIMHGPRWLWWYLTAFKDEISMTFGSDLRSITQVGVNNVTELMKRKDNARFRASLSQLRHRMIGYRVPRCIQHKMSIIFESGSKSSILSCIHSNAFKTPEHQTKSATEYFPAERSLNEVVKSETHLIAPDFAKLAILEADNPEQTKFNSNNNNILQTQAQPLCESNPGSFSLLNTFISALPCIRGYAVPMTQEQGRECQTCISIADGAFYSVQGQVEAQKKVLEVLFSIGKLGDNQLGETYTKIDSLFSHQSGCEFTREYCRENFEELLVPWDRLNTNNKKSIVNLFLRMKYYDEEDPAETEDILPLEFVYRDEFVHIAMAIVAGYPTDEEKMRQFEFAPLYIYERAIPPAKILIEANMSDIDHVNVLMIGDNGIGKSCLGNSFCRPPKNLELTEGNCTGVAMTTNIERVQYTLHGRSVCFIDTPGFYNVTEADKKQNLQFHDLPSYINFILNQVACNAPHLKGEKIHIVLFCLQKPRIEDWQLSVINAIAEFAQVMVVQLQCSSEENLRFLEVLKTDLKNDNISSFHAVLAKDKTIKGRTIPAHGMHDLARAMAHQLLYWKKKNDELWKLFVKNQTDSLKKRCCML